jgi:hypothetical protein
MTLFVGFAIARARHLRTAWQADGFASVVLALFAVGCAHRPPAPGPSPATENPGWAQIETATFRVDVPPKWAMVQLSEDEFAILSPVIVANFQILMIFSSPQSLDNLVTRSLQANAAEPQLRERVLSRQRIAVDHRPAERIVTATDDNMRFLSTFVVVDPQHGYGIAGEAPAEAFETQQGTFARIADSLHFFGQVNPHPTPLPRMALLLPSELGGENVKGNRVWLYPRALAAMEAVTQRIIALIQQSGENIAFGAVPRFAADDQIIPTKVEITFQPPNGERVTEIIENQAR